MSEDRDEARLAHSKLGHAMPKPVHSSSLDRHYYFAECPECGLAVYSGVEVPDEWSEGKKEAAHQSALGSLRAWFEYEEPVLDRLNRGERL